MPGKTITWNAAICVVCLAVTAHANAQIVEALGERALGMGGAFTAVANDGSATWWNPAGLADGPFFDVSLGRAVDDRRDRLPAGRDRASGIILSTPVVGMSVYRLGVLGAAPTPLEDPAARAGQVAGLRSWTATAVGATLVQTVVEGTHVGATVKYVRGTARVGSATPATGPEDGLEQAGALEGGRAEGRLEVDLGALSIAGPVRLGLLVRNVRSVEFADGAFRLPRQVRAGVAFAAEQTGGPPLTIAVDADLKAYATERGMRRVVAVGAEQWVARKRIGLRAGARFNQVGEGGRVVTAGLSLALRAGQFLEAHLVGGTTPAERGWGTGLRVSF